MSRESVAVLHANRMMQTEAEVRAFDDAVQMMTPDASDAIDLLRVFTDATAQHDVMWGLVHLVETLDLEVQIAALVEALPAMLGEAGEWARILHYRVLNHDEARHVYTEVLRAQSASSGGTAARGLLAEIARDEQPPLGDAARQVLADVAR